LLSTGDGLLRLFANHEFFTFKRQTERPGSSFQLGRRHRCTGIDQRSALRNLLAKAKAISAEAIESRMLEEFKEAASRILTPHASAILLDPEYGLSAARQRARNSGLLLAYERTGYDKAIPGRLPRLLDDWSVRRLADAGADCTKVLLYYSPFSAEAINNVKARLGGTRRSRNVRVAKCRFFLELVVYHDEMDEKGPELPASNRKL